MNKLFPLFDCAATALPPKPLDTEILVSEHAEGGTVFIPPARPSRRLTAVWVIGVLMCFPIPAAMVLFAFGILLFVTPTSTDDVPGLVVPILYFPAYSLFAGFLLLYQGLVAFRQRVEISVCREHVRLRQVGLIGEMRQQWPRDAVIRVYVEGGDVMAHLCIQAVQGAAVKVSNFRGAVPHPTREEWEWVAALLRQFLAGPAMAGGVASDQEASSEAIAAASTEVRRP